MDHSEPENTSQAAALNQALVDDLKKKGWIQTPHVEAAFRSVLRHHFLPGRPLEEVYSDRAISAKQDESGKWLSSSSQPAIMAIMLEQLRLAPGHRVLEIGTGPGYNAALMAHIVGAAGKVVTVEIDQDLADSAREHLEAAGMEQVQVLCADGGYGAPQAAPFDRIILTVGAPDIPPAWRDQLKPGGRLVLPLLLRGSMKSIAFDKFEAHLESRSVEDCGFISLRGDFASAPPRRVELGSDPGLYVEPMVDLPVDGEAIYGWLTAQGRDLPANVEVTAGDVLGGALWTWLALHEPRMCKLTAEGGWVDRSLLPPLMGIEAKQREAYTSALIDGTGAAVLMRPPGEALIVVPMEKVFTADSPFTVSFPLFVRQFGPDASTAQQLLAEIHSWKAAGSPTSNNMFIRAYPKDFEYRPSDGEVMLEKQWVRLVITWRSSA